MTAYDDKALLFITSTDGHVPQGRNARAHHRASVASRKAPATGGKVTKLDFGTVAERSDERTIRCRKRPKPGQASPLGSGLQPRKEAKVSSDSSYPPSLSPSPRRSLDSRWTLPYVNPSEVLLVATFHIRRMAVVATTSAADGLTKMLRRRQWSCFPYASNCFGKDACVDSAVLCVADRIRFLSGAPFSPVSMMRHYEQALRDLQTALYEPEQHHPQDILVAVQLLAVYEMLDSLDDNSWSKHIAGAVTLIQTYTTITPEQLQKWQSRGCGHALPVFGDALLSGDANFFRTYPWRELLEAVFGNIIDPPDGVRDLMRCLRLIPSLLLDAEAASQHGEAIDHEQLSGLLDRSYDLRHRMRSAMCGNALYSTCNYREMLSGHDFLGTFLAGFLALNRIIGALTPAILAPVKTEDDDANELCTQLLQLELGASVHYPPAEILAGFHNAGALHSGNKPPSFVAL